MKIAKPAKAYRKLRDQFKIELGLTSNQATALENNQPILLTEEQLDFLIDQIVALDDFDNFLTKFIHSVLPISLSLFVINERLWKMMERKSWDNDKMLAMSTIPLCATASATGSLYLLFKEQVLQQKQTLSVKYEKLCQLLFQQQEIQI